MDDLPKEQLSVPEWDAKTSDLGSGWNNALKSANKDASPPPRKSKSKKSKGKGKGKKPSEYNLFVKKMIPVLKKQFPQKQHKDLFKLVGEAWKKQK